MKRFFPYIALLLVTAELLLILLSWILSAAMPMSGIRSMLSSEGIRWFLGYFAEFLAQPVLVWLILLAMSFGCMRHSAIFDVRHTYRFTRARWLSALVLMVYVVVILMLTVVPRAVLLSASGKLWPSPFSSALVPLIAFGLMVFSMVYGIVAGTFRSFSDVYESLLSGIRSAAPLLLFYVLLSQFFHSLYFVFM